MKNTFEASFVLDDCQSFKFRVDRYEFDFSGKSLPSLSMGGPGEPFVRINDPFHIWKSFDSSTIRLATLSALGFVIPIVEVSVLFNGNHSLIYSMHDARIKSYRTEGEEDFLSEKLSITFGRITWAFEGDGLVLIGGNLIKNEHELSI